MDYFKNLLALIRQERKDDRLSWLEQAKYGSVTERRTNGTAWYPVAIRGIEPGRGDYLSIELERTTHQDLAHQFRSGMPAALFSNHQPDTNRLDGYISWLNGNQLRLSLTVDELPEWTRDGKLGVDLLFDENSYDEMENALQEAERRADKRAEGRLLRILTGLEAPAKQYPSPPANIQTLNTSQAAAVQAILETEDICIVHGPPGTGKTTTLVEAIRRAAAKGQILVTAPGNAAVDLLTERLQAAGLQTVRVGNPAKVGERQLSFTLDRKMMAHPQMKQIRQYRKQAAEYRNLAQKYKRQFGRAEREQRKALFNEAAKLMKEVQRTEQYIANDILDKAQVITATLVGSNHYSIEQRRYEMVVIDEAAQALEPASWIPILKGNKLVLAGDHFQLAPTVKSAEAAKNGLAITLQEKLAALYPGQLHLLQTQYRMHTSIMQFSSRHFYQGRLEAAAGIAGKLLLKNDQPLLFIDTAGCGFEEKKEGSSSYNPEEADLLFTHLEPYLERLAAVYPEADLPSTAIISPYRQQVELLREKLTERKDNALFKNVTANTIDSFQGQERDIVYISLVRSNPEGEIGFLADTRRMNVAMTRAKRKLVVVGDSATISQWTFYQSFIHYAQDISGYESAWTFLYPG
ncbi:MAG: AAA domain-containing protein [Flavihumibacter sp.]